MGSGGRNAILKSSHWIAGSRMGFFGCKCPAGCGTTERSLGGMRLHGKCVGNMVRDADEGE